MGREKVKERERGEGERKGREKIARREREERERE